MTVLEKKLLAFYVFLKLGDFIVRDWLMVTVLIVVGFLQVVVVLKSDVL